MKMMGVVEDIKEEDLKGEVEFVVELDRKTPTPDCEVEMAPTTINVKRGNILFFDGCDYLIRFPTALSQIVSKKSSVKLLPISKEEFLLKIV